MPLKKFYLDLDLFCGRIFFLDRMDRVHYETYATGDDMYDTMDTYETDMDSTHDDIKASKKEVKSFQLQNLINKEKYLKLVSL